MHYSEAIMFHLEPNTQKCLKEDIAAHQMVIGEFEVSVAPGQIVSYFVSVAPAVSLVHVVNGFFQAKDSKGQSLARGDSISKGRFTLNTEIPDIYEVCFISQVQSGYR